MRAHVCIISDSSAVGSRCVSYAQSLRAGDSASATIANKASKERLPILMRFFNRPDPRERGRKVHPLLTARILHGGQRVRIRGEFYDACKTWGRFSSARHLFFTGEPGPTSKANLGHCRQ